MTCHDSFDSQPTPIEPSPAAEHVLRRLHTVSVQRVLDRASSTLPAIPPAKPVPEPELTPKRMPASPAPRRRRSTGKPRFVHYRDDWAHDSSPWEAVHNAVADVGRRLELEESGMLDDASRLEKAAQAENDVDPRGRMTVDQRAEADGEVVIPIGDGITVTFRNASTAFQALQCSPPSKRELMRRTSRRHRRLLALLRLLGEGHSVKAAARVMGISCPASLRDADGDQQPDWGIRPQQVRAHSTPDDEAICRTRCECAKHAESRMNTA